MAVETRALRIKARKLGASGVREMSREELEDYIADNSKSNGKKNGKVKVAKAIKAKPAKAGKRGRPKGSKNKVDEDETPTKKRGRPKGSTNKASKNRTEDAPKRRGRPPKAESERKQSRKSTGSVGRPVGSGTGTRVAVPERIKWNRDFDFREGSTAQYILNQLRKSAKKYDDTSDVREDTFEKLVDKIGDRDELTFQNRATGKPHKGDKAEQMLRYRINRTIFDYATETGQHDGSSGGTSTKKKSNKAEKTSTKGKNAVKRGRPRKVVEDDDDDDEDEAPKRRGRPKGSTNKKNTKSKGNKAEKSTGKRGRPKGSKNKVAASSSTGKKRGRPKGSKNKK